MPRLPPNQRLTINFPVLHFGKVPEFDSKTWDFHVEGLVENPVRLTYDELLALEKTVDVSDFHCMTVPKKYAYKCAKWVRKVIFTEKKELGFWEQRDTATARTRGKRRDIRINNKNLHLPDHNMKSPVSTPQKH